MGRLGIQIGPAQPEQIFKEIKVTKHRREDLAIVVTVSFINDRPIQPNLPRFRRIQPADNFSQRRFATAIAADEKNQFSRTKSQIDRTQDKVTVIFFMMIGMGNTLELQPFEKRF